MTFERPELLALAPLLALLVSLAVTSQWRRGLRLTEAYGGREPAGRLAARDLASFPSGRVASLVGASLLLTGALAGPEESMPTPESEQPLDLVVALDISLSMAAEDIGMSRAQRATEIVAQLTEELPLERIGVVLFADWPYTLVPPTDDPTVVRFLTDSLSTDFIAARDQGTAFGSVLSHARSTLDSRRRPDATPVILLLTDGEAHGEEGSVLDSVAVAALDDVSIWAARLGTSQGGPLVQPGTEDVPLLDEFGEQVVATSDGQLLRSIASAGGGAYYDASDERGARALVEEVSALGRSVGDDDAPTNVTFWLLVMALPLLIWDGLADSGRSIRLRSEARGKS